MKQANIILQIDGVNNTVIRKEVTPAEVLLLVGMFAKNAGTNPVKKITEVGDVTRQDGEEKRRLQRMYGGKRVEAIFPGKLPRFPETFDEALDLGTSTVVEDRNLVDVDLAKI